MLHLRVVVGTPPGPNRDSSPSLVPWLLRCHIYSDTSCLPPFLKFGEQVLNQYGPAQVGFSCHSWQLHRLLSAVFRSQTTKFASPAARARSGLGINQQAVTLRVVMQPLH